MKHDVIIVGAGILGLACGVCLLEKDPGLDLLVLEKEPGPALHQSGHNSGVIHSGIYYRPDSLKATNCITGYRRLLDFCGAHGVSYEICGKMIVATEESQLPGLQELFERGLQNGLEGLRMLSPGEIREREPHAAGLAAILVPQTGIIDFRELAREFERELLEGGAQIRYQRQVTGLKKTEGQVEVDAGGESFTAGVVITCAGLFSDRIARTTTPDLPLRILPFKGEYYLLKKERRSLVNSLIYPVPDPSFPFLGVHMTRMIDGRVEAGPNAVLALKREGYGKRQFSARDTWESLSWPGFRVIARRYWRQGWGEIYRSLNKTAFVAEIQKLIPEIYGDDLEFGGAGVRAQACHRNGALLDDFFIQREESIIHVCNAPSPAATSSLSIGEMIASMAMEMRG